LNGGDVEGPDHLPCKFEMDVMRRQSDGVFGAVEIHVSLEFSKLSSEIEQLRSIRRTEFAHRSSAVPRT